MDEQLRIVMNVDGVVTLSNGMKVAAADVKALAKELDGAGANAGAASKDLGKAATAAVDLGRSIAAGDMTGAAQKVGNLALQSRGLALGMGLVAGAGVLAAAAVGTMAFAAYRGHMEQRKLNDQLVLTGNYAGLAAGEFDAMATSVARGIDATAGNAREVLGGLVASGKFTGQALAEVASAALLLQRYTGQTNEAVTKDFAQMGDGVAKWAAKANSSYHFLGIETYRYIQQLEEQGKKQEAAKVASEALSTHLGGTLTTNLGYLERSWKHLQEEASAAWDAMKGFGRAESLDDKLKAADDAVERARLRVQAARNAKQLAGSGAVEGDLQRALANQAAVHGAANQTRAIAQQRSEVAQATERAIEADKEWGRITERNLQPMERMNKELEKARQTAADSGPAALANLADQEARIRQRYAPKAGAAKTEDKSAANYVAELAKQYRAAAGEASVYQTVMEHLEINGEKFTFELYQQALAWALLQDQQKQKRAVDEAALKYLEQTTTAQAQAGSAWLDWQEVQRSASRDREFEISLIGQTAEQVARLTMAYNLEKAAKAAAAGPMAAYDAGTIDAATLNGQLQAIDQANLQERVQRNAMLAEQFKPGWKKLIDGWGDTMNMVKTAHASAMEGVVRNGESAFIEWAKTGKLNARSLVDGILDELLRLEYRKNIAKPLASFADGLLGSLFGGGVNQNDGSYTTLENMRFGVKHTGGMVGGDGGTTRMGSLALFAGAPRFHTGGIAGDEVPIIARRGEGVFTQQQMAALAPVGGSAVTVNVVNQAGSQVQATATRSPDGSTVEVLIRELGNALGDQLGAGMGPINAALQSRFGLKPALG